MCARLLADSSRLRPDSEATSSDSKGKKNKQHVPDEFRSASDGSSPEISDRTCSDLGGILTDASMEGSSEGNAGSLGWARRAREGRITTPHPNQAQTAGATDGGLVQDSDDLGLQDLDDLGESGPQQKRQHGTYSSTSAVAARLAPGEPPARADAGSGDQSVRICDAITGGSFAGRRRRQMPVG